MKKAICSLLTLCMLLSMPVFATSDNMKATIQPQDIEYLSFEQIVEINNALLEFAQTNPDANESVLDQFVMQQMEYYADFIYFNKQYGISTYGDSMGLRLNDAEKELANQHPSQATVYMEVSLVARKEALNRYTEASCWWSGNGDAFRHTYWSASMMKRFHDVFQWDVTTCGNTTWTWTDAHEQDGETWGVDHEMDVLNNSAGRNIGYDYYTRTEGEILGEVQRYVDEGICFRVGEDASGNRVLARTFDGEKN